MPVSANIAQHLPLMAARQPDRPALKVPRGRSASGGIDYLSLSFIELDAEVEAWAAHLRARNVSRGDRTLVMVRQGLPLIAAAFALFKIGAVPVVIDPGMGLRSFLTCVARSRPRVLLGIPFAQIVSRIARRSFRSVETRVVTSSSPLARRAVATPSPFAPCPSPVDCDSTDLAAILFTSGSTGAPKGVCYEHGMFAAQIRLIREAYSIEPGEIDLPMLPVFALFNPALGMTTIVPEIDPSHPAKVDPVKIVQAIRQEQVTNSFGSPTLWGKIADHCLASNITLPSLRRVLCAGAPVPSSLWKKSRHFLPNGKLHSPYGATEALPVSTVSSDEIPSTLSPSDPEETCNVLSDKLPVFGGETSPNVCNVIRDKPSANLGARGACVGRPLHAIEVKIIAITEAPIASLAEARELPAGEIGEIIVCGPVVTKTYDARPEATAAAKIQIPTDKLQKLAREAPESSGVSDLGFEISAEEGGVWHRMGDCGYLDSEGFLWFCGRKAERLETSRGPLFTEPCEQVFRAQNGVARCALIGLGQRGAQIPALVVQPTSKLSPSEKQALASELRERAKAQPHTSTITRFFFHPAFPVDVRHNAKIHRLTLAKWAMTAKAFVIP
jgi:acyl-CoA synthetase (AMP-forming)/AMP-acid ligase II